MPGSKLHGVDDVVGANKNAGKRENYSGGRRRVASGTLKACRSLPQAIHRSNESFFVLSKTGLWLEISHSKTKCCRNRCGKQSDVERLHQYEAVVCCPMEIDVQQLSETVLKYLIQLMSMQVIRQQGNYWPGWNLGSGFTPTFNLLISQNLERSILTAITLRRATEIR
jgi:hypothetical protein